MPAEYADSASIGTQIIARNNWGRAPSRYVVAHSAMALPHSAFRCSECGA